MFNDPLVYTPGDNEWTDCHRANNGAYDPLERLAVIRAMFFPIPGLALGGGRKLTMSQSMLGGFETFVENQLWFESSVAFATLHVVGSNNNLAPWFGDDTTGTKMDDPARRTAEVAARNAANIDWLDRTFALAQQPQRRRRRRVHAGRHLGGRRRRTASTARAAPGRAGAARSASPCWWSRATRTSTRPTTPLAAGDPVHGITHPGAQPDPPRRPGRDRPASGCACTSIRPAPTLFTWQRNFR